MLSNESNPACGILYIDDEEKALKYFRMAFSSKFEVFIAKSGAEGIELLKRESKKIGIVISDQRMPEMLGAEVLGIVRENYPQIVRILTTAYSDLESAIQAVNKGHIYQYVVKPWEIQDLGMVLQRAADYYHVITERNALLGLKMTTLQRIVCSDRLKWLLLSCQNWDETSRAAFHRALASFVHELPETLNPVATANEGFSARRFEISSLIRSEYENASRSLDALRYLQVPAAPNKPEVPTAIFNSLSEQLGTFASRADNAGQLATAAERLHVFLAALIERYKLSSDQIELFIDNGFSANIGLRLRSGGGSFQNDELSRTLFSLLIGEETTELSVLLFEILYRLALNNGTLTISVEPTISDAKGLNFTFDFTANAPVTPEEVIAGLYERFGSWDIARM